MRPRSERHRAGKEENERLVVYIADDDQSSKATFSLLNVLFSLQSETGKGRSPLLTLPIGK
jgi:hypothetical protein